VLGRLYSKILDRIESADYDVLSNRVGLSTTEKVRVTAQTWISSVMPGLSPIPK
jgi:phytoene/squalene synthetase